mmetsp:Transcript_37988/g.108944  ORF Transcript_37988/g.108944 Transcript_37988/m.108944 type:complete len:227 (-) Transcript_37988:142-822(-)
MASRRHVSNSNRVLLASSNSPSADSALASASSALRRSAASCFRMGSKSPLALLASSSSSLLALAPPSMRAAAAETAESSDCNASTSASATSSSRLNASAPWLALRSEACTSARFARRESTSRRMLASSPRRLSSAPGRAQSRLRNSTETQFSGDHSLRSWPASSSPISAAPSCVCCAHAAHAMKQWASVELLKALPISWCALTSAGSNVLGHGPELALPSAAPSCA